MSTRPTTKTRFRRHELKALLDEEGLLLAAAFAAERLGPDAFAGSDAGYRLATLYLDTEGYRVHRRLLDGSGTKYRIRRYGDEDLLYLERKVRRGTLVRKRRSAVPGAALEDVLGGRIEGDGWPATFCRSIRDFGLRPSLLLCYRRFAWLGPRGSRLTLDQGVTAHYGEHIRGVRMNGGGVAVTGATVLELKFDSEIPGVFKELLDLLARRPGGFSKYGTGLVACGLVPGPGEPPCPKN